MSTSMVRSPETGRPDIAATAAATIGLVFGPSTILVFLFGVFVMPLSKTFGWSKPAILTAVSIVSLMIMVASPIQGWLIDRFGARRVVLGSSIPFALGLFALSQLGPDIRGLYVAYALLPLLGIGLWPVSYLRVVSTWFERRLGLATGIANGGIGIGAALLPVLATQVMAAGSWRTAFIALGLLVLVVTLPINWIWLRESARGGREGPLAQRAAIAPAADFKPILRSRDFRILVGAFLLLGFVNTGLVVNQVSMLVDGGLTPAQAALVASVFGIAVIVGRFLTGLLLDYMPAKRLMSLVCLGGVVACAVYASGPDGAKATICAVLIGAIYGAEFDVLSFVIKRYFGIAAFGRSYGAVFAVFQFGAAIGATVLPLSKARFGSYGPGLWTYAAALALCAIAFLLLRPQRQVAESGAAASGGSGGVAFAES